MGPSPSIEEKQEASILRQPKQGEASDLYWACRAGDVHAVQQIISSTAYVDINRLEPNGSTALHAASFFGHTDVVRLLLRRYGVKRHRKNRHGLTAYEEAANGEIRELFHRVSGSRRFNSDNITESDQLFTSLENQEETDELNNDKLNDAWIEGIKGESTLIFYPILVNIGKSILTSTILRTLVVKTIDTKDAPYTMPNATEATQAIQRAIDQYVTSFHPEYPKCCDLISKYAKTGNVEHLLRLYTLETDFYRNINEDECISCIFVQLMIELDNLRNRAFQGRVYRGLTMTRQALKPYKWALKHKESILMTKTFCSTSIDENVAHEFKEKSVSNTIPVMMVFDFQKQCDTAIQLFRVSDTLPGISEFENEREVLIFPITIFHVTGIDIDPISGQHTIYLQNVPTEGGIFKLLRLAWKYHNSD